MLRLIAIAKRVSGDDPELVVDIDDDLRLVRPLNRSERVLGPPIFLHSFLAMAGYPGYEPLQPFERRDVTGYRIDTWPEEYGRRLREKLKGTRGAYLPGVHARDRGALRKLWRAAPPTD